MCAAAIFGETVRDFVQFQWAIYEKKCNTWPPIQQLRFIQLDV